MELTIKCQKCIDDADTLFNFMSKAIELIDDEVSNTILFIDTYVEGNDEIKRFSGTVASFITDMYQHSVVFDEVRRILNYHISLLNCKTSNDDSLAVLYAILKGIDDAFEVDNFHLDGLGPLDNNPNNRFRVYWFMPSVLKKGFYKWLGRERSQSSSIYKRFKNFTFFDSTVWKLSHHCDVPRGILDEPIDPSFQVSTTKRVIKIGVSPFCIEENFEFEHFGNNLFRTKYKSDQSKFVSIIENLVDKVIEKECDFFVLPEYNASPEVLNAVRRKLKEAYAKNLHTPHLTFAGSQWTQDDNNVLTVLNRGGDTIGVYYKYAPFRKDGMPTEGLRNPGKVCDYFGESSIGVLLPSICRDSIDSDYTAILVEELFPLFVVVPAWSSSSASFDAEFDNICKRFFASSVLVNSCSARKEQPEIGHCRSVYKKGTTPDCIKRVIKKDLSCEKCDSGCLFVAEYCFGYFTNTSKFVRPTLTLKRYCT